MLIGLTAMAQDSNRPPEVTNVVAQQVGQQVEISYDLIDRDGDLMTVSLLVSSDGGSNFDLEAKSLEGEVGEGIANGQGKKIVWQVAVDIPDLYGTNFVFEVVADDNVGPRAELVLPTDGASMALIPAGSFEMGDHLDGMSNALPVHTVELDAFYMDVHEVTVGQFKQFVNQSGYNYNRWNDVAQYSPGDDYPMVYVNWNDATAYANWVGKRLPTEAEWEYAARGGLEGQRYPWGNELTHDNANYTGTGGIDQWDKCSPVGSFAANGYGLYDVAGNVLEWCADWYAENYYSNLPVNNPLGPDSSPQGWRVLRGGGWDNSGNSLRMAYRHGNDPSARYNYRFRGFRCVLGLVNSVRFTALPLEAAQSPATLLEMTSGKTELPASSNSSTTVTVRLYNQDDIPIKGDMVNLTVDKGTIQSPAIDNGDGSYTATYTADNSAGTAKITALTNSGQFATATINLLEIGLSLSAPANQIDVGTTTQLNLTLQDSKGRAVAGESVQLTADQGIVQLTDNGDGTYQAQYTAAEIGGSVTITANSSGGLSQSIKLQVLDVSKDQSSIKAVGKIALQTGEDGQVDIFDLVSAARKRKPKLIGDINEDGYVDVFDLALIAIHFGEKYELDQPAIATAPAIVQRQPQGWVALNCDSADKSAMVSLSLTAQLAEVLKGYQFTLSYDPALLSVLQIQEGDAFDGDGFGFEPQSMGTGQAKFAAVNLSRLEPDVSRIDREMVLAEVIVQIHGDREQALSSIGLEEVVLSNPQGIRIPVLSQQAGPEPEVHQFALAQNYPNPFNPETWIPYHLSVDSQVKISIYDSAGKLVRRLDIGLQPAGDYQSQNRAAYWDGKNTLGEQVASGVYFYTIQAGELTDTRKMLLMK
ncbi:MAG: SUMF1/EgtB/PvdO family nonheme iron enzyme [Dehalococcoidia bacterium]|nr:SUMF1/EgtB/PvdO family nonheme iron enzyme [Dehalococcoidia bacterium]